MAKKIGRCKNYGQCELADSRQSITMDDYNFNCPKCGKKLVEPIQPPPPIWKNPRILLGGPALLLALGGLGWGGWTYFHREPTPARTTAVADCSPKPLLLEGKQTLYQRVLTRPGAELKAQPEPGPGKSLNPFLRYYVYERKPVYGQEWLKVGPSTNCQTVGWLNAGATVPWKQQLHVVFKNPAGREPILFFQQAENIQAILQSRQPAAELTPLIRTVRAGGADPRILAIEPENHIDLSDKFYLLPILDYQETRSTQDLPVTLLRVASISQSASGASARAKPATAPTEPTAPTAAVVFVIDSTISMGPYIERTKAAARQICEHFQHPAERNTVKFGLVGYRSNIQAVPGLEYNTRLFVNPNDMQDEGDFLHKVSELRPAKISSSKFDEDTYAGVMTALKEIDWTPFTGRYIVVISDAGALDANDPLSSTKMGAQDVSGAAKDRNVVVYAIHLKTPEGRKMNNHASAEKQYRTLAGNILTNEPLYYSVNAGSVDYFGAQIDCLTNSVVYNINSIDKPVNGAALLQYCPSGVGDDSQENELQKMRKQATLLGYALRLAYLGRTQGTEAPQVFESWIADKDPADPTTPSVEVRVLLTKNELSDLHNGVGAILQAAQAGRSSPEEFYRNLRAFTARKVRDPKQNVSIGELGIFDEYLADLPYRSHLMNLEPDTWASWSLSQQEEFIRSLTNKLDRYRYYEGDVQHWVTLTPDGDAGERVYPIPLDALP